MASSYCQTWVWPWVWIKYILYFCPLVGLENRNTLRHQASHSQSTRRTACITAMSITVACVAKRTCLCKRRLAYTTNGLIWNLRKKFYQSAARVPVGEMYNFRQVFGTIKRIWRYKGKILVNLSLRFLVNWIVVFYIYAEPWNNYQFNAHGIE